MPRWKESTGETEFHKELRALLANNGGQGKVAERIGYSQPRLSRMLSEHTAPSPRLIDRLCEEYGLNPAKWHFLGAVACGYRLRRANDVSFKVE